MDELKGILRVALSTVEEISVKNGQQGQPQESASSSTQNPRRTPVTLPSATTAVYSNTNTAAPARPLPVQPVTSSTSSIAQAEANFRSAFPHFCLPNPSNRKRKRPVPAYAIKDTWTHNFFLLSSPSADKTPSLSEANNLLTAGLGKRRIVFNNKRGDFNHLKVTLEKRNTQSCQVRRVRLSCFKQIEGGATRPLVPIPMQPNGYGIPYLKNVISSNATIYIRPIQSEPSQDPPPLGMTQVFNSRYVNCCKDIPVQDMKRHVEDCCGHSSKKLKCGSSLSKPSNVVDLTNQSEERGEMVKKEFKEDVEWDGKIAIVEQDEKPCEKELEIMFPSSPKDTIRKAISKAVSLNEAAEILCEGTESEEELPQDPISHVSIDSLVTEFRSNMNKDECYTLAIDREELWRGALSFYKRALTDKTLLLKDLVIVFKGEEGLDAGAMKVEYFELLLSEIQQRLFKGSDASKLPVRDSVKGFLLKLAGVIISHSIWQRGPAFSVLSPAIYYQLVANDPLIVLAHLSAEDIPCTAGTSMLHELLAKFCDRETASSVLEESPSSQIYWAIINSSHWSSTKAITDENLPLLIQCLLENEMLLSRRYEIDQLSEGLAFLGLLDVMKKNVELCFKLFCFCDETCITPERFITLIDCKGDIPNDFSRKQSYEWFIQYVQCATAEQLKWLLQFTTSFKTIPPYGLEQNITLKYRPDDDEKATLPTSLACLAIISLPTVHSSQKKVQQKHGYRFKI